MKSVSATISEVCEAWLYLNGKPFRLDMWPAHRAFYDGRWRRTLLKTSRQVAKSTTLANFGIAECSLIPHFSVMFVTPSKEQTMRFSNSRVTKVMRYSPIIHKKFLSPELSDRVLHKQFTNGSEMAFAYALDDADRIRGLSTDRNVYDEVQDLLYNPVITVGNECLARSQYAYETYAGTPKTMENTIQYLWEMSTQTEWVMKCNSCGKYQYADSEKSIGLKGLICLKCGSYLNPFEGQWLDMAEPISEKSLVEEEDRIKGFHICQPSMPDCNPVAVEKAGYNQDHVRFATKQWKDILYKRENLPPTTFRNEVLGVSDALGARMIAKDELEALCTGLPLSAVPNAANMDGISITAAGVDWSGGGTSGVSRSVLWIWGEHKASGILRTLFYRIYPGTNPVNSVEEIIQICNYYRVAYVVGDAGEGSLPNDVLRNALGANRMTQVQYGAYAKALNWNGQDRYLLDRTTMIDNYVMLLKKKLVQFGPKDEMSIAIADILNEYEEVTMLGRKVWRHSPQKPDDCLHAGLFGWLAYKIVMNDLKFWKD